MVLYVSSLLVYFGRICGSIKPFYFDWQGGDDFDWNIDDELEIENYNSSSSCLTLPNGDAGEVSF